MVDGRFSHRPEDPIRHIGRSWDLKKMSSALMGHGEGLLKSKLNDEERYTMNDELQF
jgi:hypothetical protein